jgi:hypothetical protein
MPTILSLNHRKAQRALSVTPGEMDKVEYFGIIVIVLRANANMDTSPIFVKRIITMKPKNKSAIF